MRTRIKHSAGLLLVVAAVLRPAAGAPPAIAIDQVIKPPAWALKQRELLTLNARIVDLFKARYIDAHGYVAIDYEHGGGIMAPDDVFETMYKWPLLYAIGGDDAFRDVFWKAWLGSLEQCTEAGLFVNDFVKYMDWHHNGEHYQPFWMAALILSDDPEYRRQAKLFASFYDGTNPDVPNYDPEQRVIRSMLTGGAGPVERATARHWIGTDEPGPFWQRWMNEGGDAVGHDGPINLVTSNFGTIAYLLTGDSHYRDVTLDYINAWRERAEANDGIIPSIVLPDGSVPDDWWDGVLGWNWRMFGGLFQVSSGPRAAWANALLMTGDRSYYDTCRILADELWTHKKVGEHRGQRALYVPRFYDGETWSHYMEHPHEQGVYASILANIYLATMRVEDLARVVDRVHPGVQAAGHAPYQEGGYERDWIVFLNGGNPDWPEQELDRCIARTRQDIAGLERELALPEAERPRRGWPLHLGLSGPLVNQVSGGIMPLWHGQLYLARFHYFDPQRQRVGLPANVAALVDSLGDETATLTLVNLDPDNPVSVLVQTGAYAEHQCRTVAVDGQPPVAVDGTLFRVDLAPGAGQRMTVTMQRYANRPAIRLPW